LLLLKTFVSSGQKLFFVFCSFPRNFPRIAVLNHPMKGFGRVFVIGAVLCAAWTVAADSPYERIAQRNPFALVPKPKPTPEIVQEPLPNVLLTGITTILKKKLALITMQLPKGQPESCILGEGERRGEVEVVRIDETAGVVQVTVRGTSLSLDFKANGAKANATPAMASVAPVAAPTVTQFRPRPHPIALPPAPAPLAAR
jgi:hypothetical protein